MDIVADTNILLAVALNEPEKDWIVEATADLSAIAPEILPYEVGNALSAMVKRKRLSSQEALEAGRVADLIPVRLVPVDVGKSLGIAIEHNLYAYDAYFLQCALTYVHPLLTLDHRLKQVAWDIGVKVLE